MRAVLAVALTAAAIVATFTDAMPTDFLYPAALTVNAFYFASRSESKAPDEKS